MPRFVELADEAHRSSVEATAGAYSSAIALVRAQWVASGQAGATSNLLGFGDETVDVSVDGWPTGVDGNTDPAGITAAECAGLWGKLLQSNAPRVAVAAAARIDYVSSVVSGQCRYTYQLNAAGDFIDYNPVNGEVTTLIN